MNVSYFIGHSLFRIMGRLLFRYRAVFPPGLDLQRGYLVACNHESFIDPPMVGIAFREGIHFLARRSLFRRWPMGAVLRSWNSIPVDQDRPDFTSLRTIIRLLKEGKKVLIFPEGSRSWDGELGRGQPGVGLVIAKTGAPVLPARIFGAREALPRGAKWVRRSPVTVVFGQPLDFAEEGGGKAVGRKDYQQMSDEVMAAIGQLRLPDAAGGVG
ncbi:MAG TPA: lysophospholipid acyltransferase family protein [Verrucomicrobiales bacterium]|nr:lysophospholipid acyltransferase family protein [Verrucomicrobiales bacterium]